MKPRIVASIVGVAALAVLLVGVPLAVAVKYLYASQEVLRLERQASETRQMVDPSALGTGDPIELTRAGAVSFAVYDAAGRRIAGNGPAIADDPVYAEHWAGHREVEVAVEPDRIVIRRTNLPD